MKSYNLFSVTPALSTPLTPQGLLPTQDDVRKRKKKLMVNQQLWRRVAEGKRTEGVGRGRVEGAQARAKRKKTKV